MPPPPPRNRSGCRAEAATIRVCSFQARAHPNGHHEKVTLRKGPEGVLSQDQKAQNETVQYHSGEEGQETGVL